MTYKQSVEQMTEKELRAELNALTELVRSGDATVTQANRLEELRRAKRRIRSVANDKIW